MARETRLISVWRTALLAPALWAASIQGIQAASATPDEMAEARRWVAAKFEGTQEPDRTTPGLVVAANHGPVQKNGRGAGSLRILDAQFQRGFYCHAPSKIVVRLPSPGKAFTAMVGVDSNLQTKPGRGSVVFSVKFNAQEAFRSEVLREGMDATPVAIDLDGAMNFVLEVSDAGDGMSHDQADLGEGMVQAFRRRDSIYESARLRLHGLELDAKYTVANLDSPGAVEMTGRQLAEEGLPVTMAERPGSVVFTYRRAE